MLSFRHIVSLHRFILSGDMFLDILRETTIRLKVKTLTAFDTPLDRHYITHVLFLEAFCQHVFGKNHVIDFIIGNVINSGRLFQAFID